jgi:hypothetical protein
VEIDGIVALISFAALVIIWGFAPNVQRAAEKPAAAPAPQKALA